MDREKQEPVVIVSNQAPLDRKTVTLSSAAVPPEVLQKYASTRPIHRQEPRKKS